MLSALAGLPPTDSVATCERQVSSGGSKPTCDSSVSWAILVRKRSRSTTSSTFNMAGLRLHRRRALEVLFGRLQHVARAGRELLLRGPALDFPRLGPLLAHVDLGPPQERVDHVRLALGRLLALLELLRHLRRAVPLLGTLGSELRDRAGRERPPLELAPFLVGA